MGGTDPCQIRWKVVYAIEVVDCQAELLSVVCIYSSGFVLY